jgi:hypothetical protein
MSKVLIPVFADQLTVGLSPLAISTANESVVLMMEVAEEAGTVAHLCASSSQKIDIPFLSHAPFCGRFKRTGLDSRLCEIG